QVDVALASPPLSDAPPITTTAIGPSRYGMPRSMLGLLMKAASRIPAAPYRRPAPTYASTTYRCTWMPAIHAARGFAPTAWKRRPTIVERRNSASTIVTTIPTQNIDWTPRQSRIAHDERPGGTADSLALGVAYHTVIP